MSEKPKDDGGRAFPNDGTWANGVPDGGMSMRDYFAAHAINRVGGKDFDELATNAYKIADAMIAESAKP